MAGYTPLQGPHFALTKDEQVAGFAHTQSHTTQLARSQYLTVPMEDLRELDELTRITRKPSYLVAMFSDFGVYIQLDMIKRPLDVRMVGGKMLVHVNAGQFSKLTYEAKW